MSTSSLLSLRGGTAALRLFRARRGGIEALWFGLHVPARRYIIDMSYSAHFMDYRGASIPGAMKKLVVTKLSPDFREAVSVQTVALPTPGNEELLVRNRCDPSMQSRSPLQTVQEIRNTPGIALQQHAFNATEQTQRSTAHFQSSRVTGNTSATSAMLDLL